LIISFLTEKLARSASLKGASSSYILHIEMIDGSNSIDCGWWGWILSWL